MEKKYHILCLHKQIIITLSYFNKGCCKIHAKFEFYAICAVKCNEKKKDSEITDSVGLLKMKRYTKKCVFIVE